MISSRSLIFPDASNKLGGCPQFDPEHVVEQVRKAEDEGDRAYYCLNERNLPLTARTREGYLIFKPGSAFCEGCPFTSRCRLFRKKSPAVLDEHGRGIMKEYILEMRQGACQDAYRRRKCIVEPVFGNIKNKGIRIMVRGKAKVHLWWKIACNVEKIVRHCARSLQSLAMPT